MKVRRKKGKSLTIKKGGRDMMKSLIKGLSISIAFVFVLSLVACGSRTKNIKTENVPSSSSEAFEEQETPQVIAESELETSEDKAKGKIALNPIYFDFNNYTLRPEDMTTLAKTAAWLSKNTTAKIRIEGNCDERGTSEYNLALGDRRANSAKEYLIKLGVRPSRLETVSWGEEKPLDPSHNEEAWAKNRRDDFIVVK
jgi:peptidoglycan-associated lipoprotein